MAHFLAGLGVRLGARPGRRGLLVAVLAVAAVAVLAVGLTRGRAKAPEAAAEQSFVVRRGPFVLVSTFSGQVVPGARIDLTAPFDARVAEVRFAYGDQVQEGQLLIAFDPADVAHGRAEAEIAWLRADTEAARLQNWDQGAEMRRASRQVEAAEAELGDVETKLAETQRLLDRGLVPRSEYDNLVQQRRQRQAAVAAARDDFADTQQRGRGSERRIALLQREAARSGQAGLAVASGSAIYAPRTGVIVRPDGDDKGGEGGVHGGGQVQRGQLLGIIANASGLDVAFKLDEADLAAIEPGRKAMVTGPGFGGVALPGTVLSVGGEAQAPPGGGKATFEARVRLDPLSEAVARRIRIGMTANVAIMAYENHKAVTAPPQAVQGAAPQTYVMVRSRPGRPAERRPVTIGRVGPTAVEVLSGLKPGDTVVWEASGAS
jgi:multidrug resistance efflux pump